MKHFVGQRVKIKRKDIKALMHRKNRVGYITAINGNLILVNPNWVQWEIELYPNEIEVI